MTLDPVVRLAALHSLNVDEAISLRLPGGEVGPSRKPRAVIEAVVDGFFMEIEAALCAGQEELSLSTEVAELLAIALKTRKKASSRPRLAPDQRARRAGLIAYARQLAKSFRKNGMRPGAAQLRAAWRLLQSEGSMATA